MDSSHPSEKLMFDIGSNSGKVTDFFLKEGYRVLSVDANRDCFKKCLKKYYQNEKVRVLNYAITNKSDQVIDFWESSYSVVSSSTRYWVEEGRFAGKKKWTKTQAMTITLDDLIKQYGIPEIIKIDIEGGELSAIEGLNQPIPLISFEFSEEIFEEANKCVVHLMGLGFKNFSYTERDSMTGYKDLKYSPWKELDLHKKIIPERKKLWGMIYSTWYGKYDPR